MTRRQRLSFRGPIFMAAMCISLFTFSVNADWADNFDGGLQQAWQFNSINAMQTGASATFSATSVDDALLVTDTVPGSANGAAVGFGIVPEMFEDVFMTGVINPTGEEFISRTQTLIARASVTESTFYAAEIFYMGDGSVEMTIFRNDDPVTTENLATMDIPGTYTDDYYLEFLIEGTDLTATAYDSLGGAELGSITAVDDSYASGFSGFLSFNDDGFELLGVYDDITATTPGGGGLVCDTDGDGDCDLVDIDALYAGFGSAGDLDYDGNGTVGPEDIGGWLADASDPSNTALADPADVLIAGDINFDGDIDSSDLGLLLNTFGGADVGWGGGDIDGSGNVDSSDLGLLLNNFGTMSASSAAVPEPSSLGLLCLAGVAMIATRRRR